MKGGEMTGRVGRMDGMMVAEADREKAADLLRRIAVGVETDTVQIVADALAEAREEGRDSVGLGDFMPDPCDEETPVPSTWHDAYGYGYLDCTLRKGHDGEHEHETSGLTWAA